jgi:hypothetical protein
MKVVIFVKQEHFYLSGLCLKHLSNLSEPIENITIITPDKEKLKQFYQWLGIDGITFFSDFEICQKFSITSYRLNWFRKQYVILNLDKLVGEGLILNVDADVIFNAPVKLIKNDQVVFYLESGFYKPYFDTIRDFFGLEKILPEMDSFIADFMLFDSKYLKEMRDDSQIFDSYTSWQEVVDKNTPFNQVSAISEYETYGTWMYAKYPNKMNLDKSSPTYHNMMRYHKFVPTKKNLECNKNILSLRATYDNDIEWDTVYPNGWREFK